MLTHVCMYTYTYITARYIHVTHIQSCYIGKSFRYKNAISLNKGVHDGTLSKWVTELSCELFERVEGDMKVNSRRPRLLTVHVALGRVRVGADRAGQRGGMKISAASTSGNLSNIDATTGSTNGELAVADEAEGRGECDVSVDEDVETNQLPLVSTDAAPPTPPPSTASKATVLSTSTAASVAGVAASWQTDTQSVSKSAPLPNSPSAIAKAAMTLIKKIIQEYITRTGTSSFSSAAAVSASSGNISGSGSGFDAGIECITYLSLTGTGFEDVADGSEAISSYFARAAKEKTEPATDRSPSTLRAGAISYGAQEQFIETGRAVTSLQAPSSSGHNTNSNQVAITKPTTAVAGKQQQKTSNSSSSSSSGLLSQFLQPMSPSQLSQQPAPLSRYQQAKPPPLNKDSGICRYYNSSTSRCEDNITTAEDSGITDKQPRASTSYAAPCDISDDDDVIIVDTSPSPFPLTNINTNTNTGISKLDSASSLASYTTTSAALSHKRPASLITNTNTTATASTTTANINSVKELILTRAGVDLGVFLSLPSSLQEEVLSQATASNVKGSLPVETKRSKKSSIANFFKK